MLKAAFYFGVLLNLGNFELLFTTVQGVEDRTRAILTGVYTKPCPHGCAPKDHTHRITMNKKIKPRHIRRQKENLPIFTLPLDDNNMKLSPKNSLS